MGDVVKLLITGAGAPGFAGIFSCLKEDDKLEIWCCDANLNASGKAFCHRFFHVPRANDESFVEELLNHCLKHRIQFILPIVTSELEVLAPVQNDFLLQGITILMNSEQVLNKVNNKCALYHALQNLGIGIPEYRVITHWDQLQQAASDLGYPTKDIIMKPCLSNGSRGFRVISEHFDAFQLLFDKKPAAFPLRLNELIQILKQRDFPPLLLSEYLPGPEYSVDMICDSGETLVCIPRLRKKINNGISVEGIVECNTEIINYCTFISKNLELHGFNGIQVKRATDGIFKILEVNPRLQGTTSAVRLAGVNIPLEGIRYFLNGKNSIPQFDTKVKWGLAFFRVYKDLKYEE